MHSIYSGVCQGVGRNFFEQSECLYQLPCALCRSLIAQGIGTVDVADAVAPWRRRRTALDRLLFLWLTSNNLSNVTTRLWMWSEVGLG